ncbi:PEP-CTERM sorting domain-containing protein [Pseudoduganella umbonata]|uniref:PEP-CTERM sorting domain-containing protein n=1 Tax=Pseudoduganella umbonata TaxID=864828 RepID=A0A4P8HQC8_9BURK|nr:PEP-CTERM sorting domain-containing protein [Pseudoduganella umbonata]MBB3220508.1 hypothetical protein [Pseudoduganella umbonata]QCP11973.1 PEP-CTERM sorting domain-containing protein [Pseudoduganella umbonata]
MLKKLAIAGALAACSLAQAEVQELKVVYQGLYDAHAGKFDLTKRLTANFNVDDLNQDGSYSLSEVVRFEFESITYSGECSDGSFGWWSCLNSFSYTPGSNPSFTASMRVSDELYPWSERIVAGEYYEYQSARWADERWEWTSATETYVVPANVTVPLPVPEPAQYGMLAVGLAGMLALARRRR